MRRPAPVFLAQRAYRHRRLLDAARLLPFAGLVLFLIPILWQPAATGTADTGRGAVYLFIVWALLILAALILSRRIVGGEAAAGAGTAEATPEGVPRSGPNSGLLSSPPAAPPANPDPGPHSRTP